MRSFLINDLEPIAYLIYMIAVCIQYKRQRKNRHLILVYYYLFAASSLYVGILFTPNNNWSYNLLYLVNVSIFSWYFKVLLLNATKRRSIIFALIVNVLIFIYFDFLKLNFFSEFNSLAYGVVFLTVVLFTFFYFHQVLVNFQEDSPLLTFDFLLICGYLLYFLGSFVIVVCYQNAEPQLRGSMWALQNTILFLCSISMLLYPIGKLLKRKLVLIFNDKPRLNNFG